MAALSTCGSVKVVSDGGKQQQPTTSELFGNSSCLRSICNPNCSPTFHGAMRRISNRYRFYPHYDLSYGARYMLNGSVSGFDRSYERKLVLLPRVPHYFSFGISFQSMFVKQMGFKCCSFWGRKRKVRVRVQASNVPGESSSEWEAGSPAWLRQADPYQVLGVREDATSEDIKAAFRAKVKEFHPDVYVGKSDANAITQRLLQAYEMLTDEVERSVYTRKRNSDPFEEPEEEAKDVFVDELSCLGRGCPYSCVARAPRTFQFSDETGRARAYAQGLDEYETYLAVGQCPQRCIHYLTPPQRQILEEMLDRMVTGAWSVSELSNTFYGYIAKANFENGRERTVKRKAKKSDKWVDWF